MPPRAPEADPRPRGLRGVPGRFRPRASPMAATADSAFSRTAALAASAMASMVPFLASARRIHGGRRRWPPPAPGRQPKAAAGGRRARAPCPTRRSSSATAPFPGLRTRRFRLIRASPAGRTGHPSAPIPTPPWRPGAARGRAPAPGRAACSCGPPIRGTPSTPRAFAQSDEGRSVEFFNGPVRARHASPPRKLRRFARRRDFPRAPWLESAKSSNRREFFMRKLLALLRLVAAVFALAAAAYVCLVVFGVFSALDSATSGYSSTASRQVANGPRGPPARRARSHRISGISRSPSSSASFSRHRFIATARHPKPAAAMAAETAAKGARFHAGLVEGLAPFDCGRRGRLVLHGHCLNVARGLDLEFNVLRQLIALGRAFLVQGVRSRRELLYAVGALRRKPTPPPRRPRRRAPAWPPRKAARPFPRPPSRHRPW